MNGEREHGGEVIPASGPEGREGPPEAIPWRNDRTDTLVIHCSDYRFQAHFDAFLHREMGLVSFDRLAVPGGPQFLFAPLHLPKFAWAGKKWLSYLADRHGIRQVICVAHEDCGWYKDLAVGSVTLLSLKDRQLKDLTAARKALEEMIPHLTVRSFYARVDQGRTVVFSEV